MDAHICPCGTTIEGRTHIAGDSIECGINDEERDALEEEMKNVAVTWKSLVRLESSEKRIVILRR